MKNLHVLGLSGSLRQGSFNAALLRGAVELAPEGLTLEIFDLAPIPLFNVDLETSGIPEAVKIFKNRIVGRVARLDAPAARRTKEFLIVRVSHE